MRRKGSTVWKSIWKTRLFLQTKVRHAIAAARRGSWLLCLGPVALPLVRDADIHVPGHAFDHVLGGHLSLDLEKRISRPFGVFTAICAFHKISRNFTDFHGISRPFAGISRSFHEISRFFTAMSGRTPLSRPLGGFTAISPCGTRPPKTRSYACLGAGTRCPRRLAQPVRNWLRFSSSCSASCQRQWPPAPSRTRRGASEACSAPRPRASPRSRPACRSSGRRSATPSP